MDFGWFLAAILRDFHQKKPTALAVGLGLDEANGPRRSLFTRAQRRREKIGRRKAPSVMKKNIMPSREVGALGVALQPQPPPATSAPSSGLTASGPSGPLASGSPLVSCVPTASGYGCSTTSSFTVQLSGRSTPSRSTASGTLWSKQFSTSSMSS